MNTRAAMDPKTNLLTRLSECAMSLSTAVATEEGDWIVKGFIDIARNIYTISVDTKVVSKIMELLLFPSLCDFANRYNYKLILCEEQNHYPDITFVDELDNKFAVDLKSTYRKDENKVNGMTLGAFTGYFRDRSSNKNVKFPYGEYSGHIVLGLIYSRADSCIDERKRYPIEELQNITSVVRNFAFFVHEKYKIAAAHPGSGNTKNIGSVTSIDDLTNGTGPFATLGESVFDDYWMNYLTLDMARAVEFPKPPYSSLKEYYVWKGK